MTDDMLHVVKWHNGSKDWSPFSDAEMSRRQNNLRAHMEKNRIDAALFTSYHNICYYSGFLYCYFGRKYGMVITANEATTITAAIDGGQPWRRSFGDNVTYTDWRKDNFFRAVQHCIYKRKVRFYFRPISFDRAQGSHSDHIKAGVFHQLKILPHLAESVPVLRHRNLLMVIGWVIGYTHCKPGLSVIMQDSVV